jgi:hypothetical protein
MALFWRIWRPLFQRQGRINWDHDPEFMEGDFFDLKISSSVTGTSMSSTAPALLALCEVYKYDPSRCGWFPVDTAPHMEPGPRFFTSVIHEFAKGSAKNHLISEITARRAFTAWRPPAWARPWHRRYLTALGSGELRSPAEYFDLFRNSTLVQRISIWFRNKVVTLFDGHDLQVQRRYKGALCGDPAWRKLLNVRRSTPPRWVSHLLRQRTGVRWRGHFDRYIREPCSGEFGASAHGRHFF